MIIAYALTKDSKLQKFEIESEDHIPKNIVWIDLIEPSVEEEKKVEKMLKIDTPTREEMDKIEVLSPFYKEDDSYYMTITSINKLDQDYPEGTAITFILTPKALVTLRYSRPRAFTSFSSRALRNSTLCKTPDLALEGLVESIVHGLADALDKTGTDIDQLLVDVFDKPSNIKERKKVLKKHISEDEDNSSNPNLHYTNLIKKVGRAGNLISKIKESLVSLNRMLIFFSQIDENRYLSKKDHRVRFRNLTREIMSLTEYANFLAQRNGFLLDATLGMINVEQNLIIKVFTVAAAVFLPPTLIASIYGMNFNHMPELDWQLGYPFALVLIVLSAVLPYYYFKRKDWL